MCDLSISSARCCFDGHYESEDAAIRVLNREPRLQHYRAELSQRMISQLLQEKFSLFDPKEALEAHDFGKPLTLQNVK